MNPIMLGDLSARRMDMPLADLVYLQMRPVALRRRRAARPAGRTEPERPPRERAASGS